MKLKKKTLFECSIAIPVIESDKEGLLVGGFSGISAFASIPATNAGCDNIACVNAGCINYGCSNGPCANQECAGGAAETGTPTPTPTSAGSVPGGLLFGF